MELFSGKFPGYFRTGNLLHSRNVLFFLDLCYLGMAQDHA